MDIIWSPQSRKDFWQNIHYLESEWTFQDVINFMEEVERIIELLSIKNVQFVSTNYRGVNKVVITKQITLYYKIDSEKLELLRFWNTYQDLKNFKI